MTKIFSIAQQTQLENSNKSAPEHNLPSYINARSVRKRYFSKVGKMQSGKDNLTRPKIRTSFIAYHTHKASPIIKYSMSLISTNTFTVQHLLNRHC